MKTSVKFILVFILLTISCWMRAGVLNSTEEASVETCQFSESSIEISIWASSHGDISNHDKILTFSLFDADLAPKLVSESNSFSNNYRLRRLIEASYFLKGMMQKLCLRENLLVLDKSKSYSSDKDPCCIFSSCEYYVFALRRILI